MQERKWWGRLKKKESERENKKIESVKEKLELNNGALKICL